MSQEVRRPEGLRVRPASAKASSEVRQKTPSSKSHKPNNSDYSHLKTNIEGLFYKTTRYSGQGIGLNLGDEDLQKLRPTKVAKSKELLYDENMQLKQAMNSMSNELRNLKVKAERNRVAPS